MKKIAFAIGAIAILIGAATLAGKANPPVAAIANKPADSAASLLAHEVPVRVLGKADAPVKMDEYVSLTCPHCARYYTTVFPLVKEKYVDTGKLKVIIHDFPNDGPGLKAGALARCMPEDMFYPFVSILFQNQNTWAMAPDPETYLTQYAKLGGLPEEKVKSCIDDSHMQDALVAARDEAIKDYNINATPSFVFNDGAEKVEGERSAEEFGTIIDRLTPKP